MPRLNVLSSLNTRRRLGRQMPRKPLDFDAVRAIGLALPDVVESTSYGAPSLKIGKQLLACPAIHKSAEPNSLIVRIPLADRDRLLEEQPAVYYVTDHYVNYACILVRLSAIRRDALRELFGNAWRFVMEQAQHSARKRGNRRRR